MKPLKRAAESHTSTPQTMAETPNIVSQPAKLNELMEVINVMGNISEKVAEQNVRMSSSGSTQAGSQAQAATARDEAIANLPKKEAMQEKLATKIKQEIGSLERLAKKMSDEQKQGWAYEITKIYARIHRLASLLKEISRASIETVKRFYIHVFIDNQPLLSSGTPRLG